MKRIQWVDWAKSTGIFLVVLVHTHCEPTLTYLLKAFLMPLFFFISGFLFSMERNPQWGRFALKRFRQLMIPYLWINLVAYLLWVFLLRHFGDGADSAVAWHEPLVGIALGIPPALLHDIPVWSLLCFFVVEMLYYATYLLTSGKKWIILTLFLILSCVNCTLNPTDIGIYPLAITPALCGTVFYTLGVICRSWKNGDNLITKPSIITFAIAFAALWISRYLNSPVSYFTGGTGNYGYFLFGAIGGIVTVIQLSALAAKAFKENKLILTVSKGTLIICGFHILAFAAIKGVFYFAGLDVNILMDGIVAGVLTSITATAACMPVIWFIRRYAPWLTDK